MQCRAHSSDRCTWWKLTCLSCGFSRFQSNSTFCLQFPSLECVSLRASLGPPYPSSSVSISSLVIDCIPSAHPIPPQGKRDLFLFLCFVLILGDRDSCSPEWPSSCYMLRDSIEFLTLLPLFSSCWDCRHVPHSACPYVFLRYTEYTQNIYGWIGNKL